MSVETHGRLLSAATIERGVETTLRYFLNHYLGEVLAQNGHGRGDLPDVRDLLRVLDVTQPPSSGQIALAVVASPGTTGDARREADGYTAVWDVRAAVIVPPFDVRVETREAAQMYAAAAGVALSHQGVATVGPDFRTWVRDADGEFVTLEGSTVQWQGETYRLVPRMQGVMAGEARWTVTVEGARSLAPLVYLDPPEDPDTGLPGRDEPEAGVPSSVDPSITVHPIPVED